MKRKRLGILVLLIVCFASLSSQARSVHSSSLTPESHAEVNPQHGLPCRIDVVPEQPTEADPIQITSSGGWKDSCGPNLSTYRLEGHRIIVDAVLEYPPGRICAYLYGSPWKTTVDIGCLSSGLYTIELYVPVVPGRGTNPCAVGSLTVLASTTNTLRDGITVNELLIDPNGSSNFDTDGNGTADALDEFVEVYNASGSAVDIGGLELWDDGQGQWFTFPPGTVLEAAKYAVVVCGVQEGGSLPTVSGGNLAFDRGRDHAVINDDGDNVVLYDPLADEYIQLFYSGNAADDPPTQYEGFSASATRVGSAEDWGQDSDGISLVREPAGDTNIVQHNTVSSDNASPGGPTIPNEEEYGSYLPLIANGYLGVESGM